MALKPHEQQGKSADAILYLVSPSSHLFRCERILQRNQIPCHPIPNPRHIEKSCGACLVVKKSDYDHAQAVLHPTPGLIYTWREDT